MRKNFSWTTGDETYYQQYQAPTAAVSLIALDRQYHEMVNEVEYAEFKAATRNMTPAELLEAYQTAIREESADPSYFPAETDEDEFDPRGDIYAVQ